MSEDVSTDEGPKEEGQVSEEEVRHFVEQLRSAPAETIVADVFSSLLNAAQVKLGRRDARLFIDLCAVMVDHARPNVSADLARQVDGALGQLRMAQISAENEASTQDEPEPNDLSHYSAPTTSAGQPATPAGPPPAPPSSSKLWVPGQ